MCGTTSVASHLSQSPQYGTVKPFCRAKKNRRHLSRFPNPERLCRPSGRRSSNISQKRDETRLWTCFIRRSRTKRQNLRKKVQALGQEIQRNRSAFMKVEY